MEGIDLTPHLPIPDGVSQEYLTYYRMLPLRIEREELHVAVAGEPHQEALADLAETYGAALHLHAADQESLQEAIRRAFAASESIVGLVRDLNEEVLDLQETRSGSTADVRGLANQPPVIRYVNLLIREAHSSRASDIHLETTRDGLRVRLRIDGVLAEVTSPPRGLQDAVISRIKLLAELDIAERRAPQDGRVRVRLEDRDLDLRVGTMPSLHGEAVVLRLLDHGGRPVSLDELGMDPSTLANVRRLAAKPHGVLLSTGPTGSGKTTTLYAALGLRDSTTEKVITVEDPIEYHLPGVTQVPVHSRSGVSFSAALRSLLRHDPDVIMVGEMRDSETASMAIQSAMTGHMVFSTLHTNDACGAIGRLNDLGVAPYLVAATLEGVLAQRLVRRICPDCRVRYRPDPESVAYLIRGPVEAIELERGAGCSNCRDTGYRGRIGLFELLAVDDEIRAAIGSLNRRDELKDLATKSGMVSLRQDGWHKIQAGLTTVEEVLRVTGE